MMERRKDELIKYVNLLRGLEGDGFNCKKELSQALEELHSIMLKEKPKINILVLEKDKDGVEKTIHLFQNILYMSKMTSRTISRDMWSISNGRTSVMAVTLTADKNTLRGYRYDYVINNTGENIDLNSLGFSLK